jgi:membrane fusion protein, multidrug efflux system
MLLTKPNPFIGLLLPALLLFSACSHTPESTGQQTASIDVPLVTVHNQDVAKHTISSGTVTSDKRISVASRLSGYIGNIEVREGDHVKQGDPLFRVDPVDVTQAVTQARADLRDAEADLNRYQALLKANAVSQQQFDKVQLRATLAKSRLAQAENQLQYAEVKAPVDGTVVKKLLNTGDLASPGATVLILENAQQLSVETYVSERFIAAIHVGDQASVELASMKEPVEAVVRQVVSAADPLTHQFLVKLSLPSGPEVLPGMFAEVRFTIGSRQALLLPAAAVVERNGLHGVYIADANNILHYRLIRPGREIDGHIEALAGLNDGDRIAASVPPQLVSGMKAIGS